MDTVSPTNSSLEHLLDVQKVEAQIDLNAGEQRTVKNTATGRAQAKIFAVCIKQQTNKVDGHSHNLIVSAPVTDTATATPGVHEAVLPCPAGQVAIQPGTVNQAQLTCSDDSKGIVAVKCSGACVRKAKLLSAKTVKVGHKKVRKGTVLAKGSFRFTSAGKRKVKLKATAKGRKVLKLGGKAVLKLSSDKKKLIRIR